MPLKIVPELEMNPTKRGAHSSPSLPRHPFMALNSSSTDATTLLSNYSYRDIWKIAFPVLISALVEQLVGMTDTAFLGRVGEIELGASALGGIFFIVVFMLILGFCSGAQILMGRRNGEQNYQDIGVVFYHSLAFLSVTSTVILIIIQTSGPYLLSRVISNPQVYEAAWTYLEWRMWGIYFSMVACLFRAFFVATTQTGTLKFNSIVMVLSNVVFDYLLIFGHFGFPKLGIAGAAIASSMASGFSMLFFIGYTWWKVDYHKFALHRLPKFKWRLLGKMLNISIWTMVQNFLSLTTWFVFFIAVEHLGSRELAATNVMRAISNFMFVTLVAFASTASTLTSNLLGADHREAVVPMIKRATLMAVVSIVPLWMLLWIFPVPIVGIFTNEAPTIAACIEPLRVLSVSSTLLVPGFILFSCISGSGNTRSALVIELIALFFYVGFISYVVFYLRCSLTVAWCAELFYSLTLLLGSFLYMRRGTWLNKKI